MLRYEQLLFANLEEERARQAKLAGAAVTKAKDRRPTGNVSDMVTGPNTPSNSSASVKVLQYTQPDLRQKLELAVQSGHTVMLEGVGTVLEPWLDAVLTKQVRLLSLPARCFNCLNPCLCTLCLLCRFTVLVLKWSFKLVMLSLSMMCASNCT